MWHLSSYCCDFDFGIVNDSDDIIMLIEYDGEQHYFPINFSRKIDANEAFKEVKLKDGIKNEYCLKNNIPLKRISYEQDIEAEMRKILNEVKK